MIDFDQLHGTWVTDERYKGSYGRIAYRESEFVYWVRWNKHITVLKKSGDSASRVPAEYLKILPVEPEPWYRVCLHCGNLPFEESPNLTKVG